MKNKAGCQMGKFIQDEGVSEALTTPSCEIRDGVNYFFCKAG
jgi:hypothetical protein